MHHARLNRQSGIAQRVIDEMQNKSKAAGQASELAHEALEALLSRGEHALHRQLERLRERTAVGSGKLQALSPLNTLGRGYVIVQKLPAGEVVTDSTRLAGGDRLRLRFQRGEAVAVVERVIVDRDRPAGGE